MANATYTAAQYFSDQPIPACINPGDVKVWADSITTNSTLLVDTDSLKWARIPKNHIVLKWEAYIPDWDTGGTALAIDLGTTDNDDTLAAALVIGTAGYFTAPLNGATSGLAAGFSDTPPDEDYDLISDVTASATTGTSGTAYFRVYYTKLPSVKDPSNSPAVVEGTE